MKFITPTILMTFITVLICFSSLTVEVGLKPSVKVKQYVNEQANTLWLETHFGQPLILNKEKIKELKGKKIYHIDLVYTAYHEAETFDQNALNKIRIKELERLLPQIKGDNPDWEFYEQTGAAIRETAKKYFHGFVIHYGTDLSYKEQASFFEDIQKPFSKIELINETGGRVEYYTGSVIDMEAYAVVYENGEPVEGVYELYYREFKNQAEIALSGIPMLYNENGNHEVFSSVGMYEIRAKKNGKDLRLVKPAIIHFQCTDVLPDVSFFEMNDDGNWKVLEDALFTSTENGDFTVTITRIIGNQRYQISLDGLGGVGKRVTVKNYKPEGEIDQGAYQGYSRIKQQQVIDKSQVYTQLSRLAWRKFMKLYESVDSINAMVENVNKTEQSALVYQKNIVGFLEAVMEQDFEDLKMERMPNKDIVYSSGGMVSGVGLVNVVGDEPIPSAPALVNGLKSKGFGVYNCDQTYRIVDPIALQPTYFDKSDGTKLENLYAACVIDLDLNASLSYHPNHLVCNDRGNTKVLVFSDKKEIYLFEKSDFAGINMEDGAVDMFVTNITDRVKNTDDLQNILNI